MHDKEKKKEREVQQIGWTNLSNEGLTSADRSNKATLPLTVPCSIQVVCKRFTPAHMMICNSQASHPSISANDGLAHLIWFTSTKLYFNSSRMCGTNIIASSMDSGLEAFSHNPADDSFAPLPDRTGANTKYLNERFLSY
jgi:hypothetical protein